MRILGLSVFVLLLTSPLFANSFNGFATEQGQYVYLGNPNLIIRPEAMGTLLGFGTRFPNTFRGTITLTFSIFGQSYVQSTDITTPAIGVIFEFAFPQGDYLHPAPATLTVDLSNVPEHQYSFLVSPVPEPGTFVFLGTGLAALICGRFYAVTKVR